jgi:hypothetical protein
MKWMERNMISQPWSCRHIGYILVLPLVLMWALAAFAEQSVDEQAVWKLESAYWNYVKSLDLDKYRDLWHPNFVGWPSSSPQPARRDHITDWITAYTKKGQRLQWYHLEQAASQATENVVVVHYWLIAFWADSDGNGEPSTIRLTHTWIRTAGGWQIIGGMAAPPPPTPSK